MEATLALSSQPHSVSISSPAEAEEMAVGPHFRTQGQYLVGCSLIHIHKEPFIICSHAIV